MEMILKPQDYKKITTFIKRGAVGVIPTDTIYGIVGLALLPKTVEAIYRLRKRAKSKPMIILISSITELEEFGIKLTKDERVLLKKIWPNPVSVILPCNSIKFSYLHRGKNSLAFRFPKDEMLIKILKKVGPLVVPSANFEGDSPSETIDDAKKYFGDKVSFYVDKGLQKSSPSTIIKLRGNSVKVVRQGEFKV